MPQRPLPQASDPDRFRDVKSEVEVEPELRPGRKLIVSIGIDRYARWPALRNAERDALGVLGAFRQFGFEPFDSPLINEAAGADAVRALTDRLRKQLTGDDSLVVFFAGHGHTVSQGYDEEPPIKTGYLIPADGDPPEESTQRWLRVDSWLSDLARLPARHILVLLDACHSGIAVNVFRGEPPTTALKRVMRLRSRKVITSALEDQRALDNGPREGHSLFAGYLLEGLAGGLGDPGALITGSQIAQYLRNEIMGYRNADQTPDFGALEQDKRGELVIRMSYGPVPSLNEALGARKPRAVASVPGFAGPTTPPPLPAAATGDGKTAVAEAVPVQARPDPPAVEHDRAGVVEPTRGARQLSPVVDPPVSLTPSLSRAMVGLVVIAACVAVIVLVVGLRRFVSDQARNTSTDFKLILQHINPWRRVSADGLRPYTAISSTQITVADYAAYLEWRAGREDGRAQPRRPEGTPTTAHADLSQDRRSVAAKSCVEAQQFCNDAGARLLTSAEWRALTTKYGDIENADNTLGPLREWTLDEHGQPQACGADRRGQSGMEHYETVCAPDNPSDDIGFRCATVQQ
jgi:hypothetical protein